MIGNASKLFCHPERLSAFWDSEPVVPITVEIHPTNKCNQACRYCTVPHNDVTMGDAELADLLDQCKDICVEGVVFSGGGEPLLGPTETNREMPTGLITNGSVKPKDESLWGRFEWVRFSVDTSDSDMYEVLRGVPMPDCLCSNIATAAKLTTVGVQMVLTPATVSGCLSLLIWAKSLGADYLHIRPDECTENPTWLSRSQRRVLEDEAGDKLELIVRDDKHDMVRSPKCHAANFILTVGADLNCWVCACGSQRTWLGDLRRQSLADIVFGKRRAEAIAFIDANECPRMCKGAGINAVLEECRRHSDFL